MSVLAVTALSGCSWLARFLCQTIMEVIFLLIALSIIVAVGFLAAFLWAVKSGQYDDDSTPAMRILFDDKKSSETNK